MSGSVSDRIAAINHLGRGIVGLVNAEMMATAGGIEEGVVLGGMLTALFAVLEFMPENHPADLDVLKEAASVILKQLAEHYINDDAEGENKENKGKKTLIQ